MKHVIEFYGKKPLATGSGRRYIGKNAEEWTGFRAEILVTDTNGDGDSGDSLYLEGDGESLRAALQAALRIVDFVEKIERERLAKRVSPEPTSLKCRCEYGASGAHEHGCPFHGLGGSDLLAIEAMGLMSDGLVRDAASTLAEQRRVEMAARVSPTSQEPT